MKPLILLIILIAIIYVVTKCDLKFDISNCDLKPNDLQERSRDLRVYRTYGNYCPELLPEGAVSHYMLTIMPAKEV